MGFSSLTETGTSVADTNAALQPGWEAAAYVQASRLKAVAVVFQRFTNSQSPRVIIPWLTSFRLGRKNMTDFQCALVLCALFHIADNVGHDIFSIIMSWLFGIISVFLLFKAKKNKTPTASEA